MERCDLRTDFQRDRDRITHCKSFRRLMHKTQVFISPEGDHYRTRLTHTLEVAQIARTIARALRLNEDLTEAIALGHDLGHTPFGHTGEDALDKLMPGGFHHNEQSVRVVELLENDGRGLNLTWEVTDGILHHRSVGTPSTLEAKIVQKSDKIAYMNHDIDDALRSGILHAADIPREVTDVIGGDSSTRIDFLVRDIITHSAGINDVVMSDSASLAMKTLRSFLFENVYATQLLDIERKKIQSVLGLLFSYYLKHVDELPEDMLVNAESDERAVCDYIACMTDRFARKSFEEIYIPEGWKG
jgi:dGTPase